MEHFLPIFKIFLILLFIAFSLYIPLVYFLGKSEANKITIPLSISIEMLFGYIFYNLGGFNFFPFLYFFFILLINIYFLHKLNKKKERKRIFGPNLRLNKTFKIGTAITILIIILTIFTRFYDSMTTAAPGNIDTINHIEFLNQLKESGRLSLKYYAPGFHIFIYPLTVFISNSDIYRFSGSVIGIITVLTVFLYIRKNLKIYSLALLILMFSFPVFNQLSLQTISFFPSALTFLFLISFLYVLNKNKKKDNKIYLVICAILSVALAISVPYFYVGLIPAIFFLLIITFFYREKLPKYYIYLAKIIIIITFFGLFASLGHVFLQTKIINQTQKSFPKIRQAKIEDDIVKETSNYEKKETSNYEKSDNSSMNALKSTFLNIISLKNIRPLKGMLGIGSYMWILFSAILISYSIRKKNINLLIISSLSLIFGIATETGILEMTYYRGRLGWYLMFLSILGFLIFFDSFYKEKYKKIFLFSIIILGFLSFLDPPEFYRRYYKEIYDVANNIKNEFPNKKIQFLTNNHEVNILSSDFQYLPIDIKNLEKNLNFDEKFIILEKKFLELDPKLSQKAISIDKDFVHFKEKQQIKKKEFEDKKNSLMEHPDFLKFKKIWENENIEVYKL
jgi:hypothetical protein